MTALLALLFLTAAGPPAAASSCGVTVRTYARKAALPAGAQAALFPMAERGGRFNLTDDIGPDEVHLPSARFLSARQTGCALSVRYEYGGYVHGFATALLERRGRVWLLVRRR